MQSLNIVFTGENQVEVRQEPVRALAPDEVLVQTHKTLISTGTEGICLGRLFEEGTLWAEWVRYPFYPGYCHVGHIAAVGEDVRDYQVGQRVATRASHRQVAVLSAAHLHPVPDGVSDEEAAWIGMASIVQSGIRRAGHVLGDAVVVVGAGLLGQLVVQYTRLLGARQVISVDPAARRIEMACAHGATAGLPQTVETAREEILRLTDGIGAEVVYDVTGNFVVLEHALPLVRRLGTLLLLGDTGYPSQQKLTRDVVPRSVRIVGAHDNNPPRTSTDLTPWSHAQMIQLFFTYLLRGEMRVADLITHRYAPQEAPEAYRMLREERPTALGVIFDWEA
jgi:2-desacetyl-2-hydroxyethyl bacteriochlorophyllide A dehydrogenase